MIKKFLVVLAVLFFSHVSAMAIEPPAGAPVPWIGNQALYTSVSFNDILEAYGLTLNSETDKGVASDYASASGGTYKFNDMSMAYRPPVYHTILTSYDLELKPENVTARLGELSYAFVKDGKVVFGDLPMAYTPLEWQQILGAYSKVMVAAAAPVAMAPAKAMPGDSDGDGVTDDKDACPGTPKGVKVNERGCWSHSAKLLFELDKSEIRKEYYPVLNETKAVFDAQPTMRVRIVGYTCDLGTAEYNLGLSQRRAIAVEDYLVNTVGIDPSRLEILGMGESDPAYPNDSEANREKNRRVVFVPIM